MTKPAYRDRYPCPACGMGYLDCMASGFDRMCCKDCDGHPARFEAGVNAYTPDEIEDMKVTQDWSRKAAAEKDIR